MKLKRLVQLLLSALYLALVVLTIPLAFDLGGVECGLLYLLVLLVVYFVLTLARLLSRRLVLLRPLAALYYAQHFCMPLLLMYMVSYYTHGPRHFFIVKVWRYALVHCTLVFTISEGFCLLLLMQAVGQTLRWLTAYKLDLWLFVLLIGLGCTITGGLYFLYRIYVLPFLIGLGLASLIGSLLTFTVGVGFYGIVSKRGSMIELSLLFAYIVRCIYETFPSLAQDAGQTVAALVRLATTHMKGEIAKLPPPLLLTVSVVPFLAANFPSSVKAVWGAFLLLLLKLTVPLLVNLAYRIGVFYAATKIIPSLYHGLPYSPPRTPMRLRQPLLLSVSTLSEVTVRRAPSRVLRLIYAFLPCIIIAVYTHLMLLYNGELGTELPLWGWWSGGSVVVHPWQFWNWVNMALTLLLYMMELFDGGNAMTSHWKVD